MQSEDRANAAPVVQGSDRDGRHEEESGATVRTEPLVRSGEVSTAVLAARLGR
ncbi:hypothetical protein [Microbacterium paraoxydans]|uniref:hypothetical protein n=1 Tax=Microbacterium paraoxydans TaxID=199592 RepID=UPI003D762F3A